MTRKVFLDASVIIAGSASRSGASRAVLNLAEKLVTTLVVALNQR